MYKKSIAFLFVLYAGLFLLDSCGPKCPAIGKSRLDHFFVEQVYETNSGLEINADENGVFPLEKATTFRFTAAVNTEEISQVKTTIFSAYALSCAEPGFLMSDTKLDPASLTISVNKDITIDSLIFAAGSNLSPIEEVGFSENGYNSFYVSLGDDVVQRLAENDSILKLSVAGKTYDGIDFTSSIKLKFSI